MKFYKNGVTRLCFLIGNYVIKIPNFTYCHKHFLQGCYVNWSERNYYKTNIKADYKDNMVKHVSPSYFCSWFGLFQIQAKCSPKKEDLTEIERKFFEPLCCGDNKKENFGYYNGKLVCLDYP